MMMRFWVTGYGRNVAVRWSLGRRVTIYGCTLLHFSTLMSDIIIVHAAGGDPGAYAPASNPVSVVSVPLPDAIDQTGGHAGMHDSLKRSADAMDPHGGMAGPHPASRTRVEDLTPTQP